MIEDSDRQALTIGQVIPALRFDKTKLTTKTKTSAGLYFLLCSNVR